MKLFDELMKKDEVFYFKAWGEDKVIYKRVPGIGFYVKSSGKEIKIFPYTDLLMDSMSALDETMLTTKEEYEKQN